MLRYFVAIPLPNIARQRLLAAQPPASEGIRLLDEHEFHLTLHFLGELTPTSVMLVRTALSTVSTPTFTITLRGVGGFPSSGPPHVLWAGVESPRHLAALHTEIGFALTKAIGFEPEARYTPHVTLARVNGSVPDLVPRFLAEHHNLCVPAVSIEQFALYSSSMENDVPRYREEARYELSGESGD